MKKLQVPKNGLFGLSGDEEDVNIDIKNKIDKSNNTSVSTKDSTINSTNGVTKVDNVDNTTNSDITNSNPNNNTGNESTINTNNDNKFNTNTKNNNNTNNNVNVNTNTINTIETNNKDINSSDDIINGIIIPNNELYLDTRKQRSYYVKHENLKKMETIVKKYGIDRSDMVNQSLEMFFKALERLENKRKEKT